MTSYETRELRKQRRVGYGRNSKLFLPNRSSLYPLLRRNPPLQHPLYLSLRRLILSSELDLRHLQRHTQLTILNSGRPLPRNLLSEFVIVTVPRAIFVVIALVVRLAQLYARSLRYRRSRLRLNRRIRHVFQLAMTHEPLDVHTCRWQWATNRLTAYWIPVAKRQSFRYL